MYDHQTESLWSQIKGEAVTGTLTGTELEVLPSTLTTWKKWRKQHPQSLVLTTDTGHSRNYDQDPYLDYYSQKRGLFSFFKLGPNEKEKELVVGVTVAGKSKAYLLESLRSKGSIRDKLGGQEIVLDFNTETDRLTVTGQLGDELPHMVVYWFVWKGIWPETERYRIY